MARHLIAAIKKIVLHSGLALKWDPEMQLRPAAFSERLLTSRPNMNTEVAIITPTKDRLNLLCQTMDSIQRQSFDAWEHLIVDDGSDDGTPEEVARRSTTSAGIWTFR